MSIQMFKKNEAILTDGSSVYDANLFIAYETCLTSTTTIHCVDEAHLDELCKQLKKAGFKEL